MEPSSSGASFSLAIVNLVTFVEGVNHSKVLFSNASIPHLDPEAGTRHFIGDLGDEETKRILWILTFVVTPFISILGIIGNSFSIIILKKHGLKKCSNILLFSLAISDISYLIGFNSIGKMFYEFGRVRGFAMSYGSAYFMYVIYHICDVMDWAGGAVSFNLPVVITIERLVAVFLPLKFPLLITPKRTAFVVVCIYVFWYTVTIYTRVWFQFSYNDHNAYNISVGLVERSDAFYRQQHVSAAIQGLIIYLCTTLPLPIVVLGCICIGIKVKLASMKRLQMTSKTDDKKPAGASRTTRTLISVCAVYSVACLFTTLPQHMPQFMFYTLFTDAPNNTAKVIYQTMNLVLCINSSGNFLIYVVTNKKFRDTQKEIITQCFVKPNK